jgi:hypothetical protein
MELILEIRWARNALAACREILSIKLHSISHKQKVHNVKLLAACQFGQFRRPSIGRYDLITGNPMGVDPAELIKGFLPFFRLLSTNQNSIRIYQVPDCRPFG